MRKLTYEYVKFFIESVDGYRLISTGYVNTRTKLVSVSRIITNTFLFGDFKKGHRCKKCASKIVHDNQKNTYDYVKRYIEERGFILISNVYEKAKSKIILKCPHGHVYKTKFNTFQQGCRCPYCSTINGDTSSEKEIVKFIKLHYNGTIIENDRSLIKNHVTNRMLELDIYLPDIRKAIEYNGTYWHSFDCAKHKDKLKILFCKEHNIDLLVINESEWVDNNNLCLNKVKYFLNNVKGPHKM